MEGTFVKKIGNVIYTVKLRSSENAKEDLETKLKKLIEKEVMSAVLEEVEGHYEDAMNL